jgi:lipopolysaccharide transport system permease protein
MADVATIPVIIRSSTPAPIRSFLNPVAMLRSLWSHRELIRGFASREVLERHKGALLGVGWNIASPLLQLLVYTAVFGYLFGTRWDRGHLPEALDFPLAFFAGQLVFHIFAEALGRGPTMISSRPNLVRRVVFPLEILPAAGVLSSLITALVTSAILWLTLAIAMIAGKGSVPWTIVLAPVVFAPLVLWSLGVSWLLAAAGVFLRDVRHVMVVFTQMLMFATPLFYRIDQLPEQKRWLGTLLQFNPMTVIVENARRVMLWGEPIEWAKLGLVTLAGLIVMQVGYAVFMRVRPHMADMH